MALETLKDVLLWLETQFGDKEAVVDCPGGKRWSFHDLNDRSRRICASYARDAGVRKGDRVGWLALGSSADLVALGLGARKMGAVPVIMNARAGPERMAWMIDNVGIKALAYTPDCAEMLERVRQVGIPSVRQFIAVGPPAGIPGEVALDEIYDTYRGAGEPDVSIDPGDLCLLAYTSGTTGKPKPVMHVEAEWSWTSLMMAYVLGLYFDDVALVAMPPSFIGWAHVTCAALRTGAKQCCFRFDPKTFSDIASSEAATHALLTPTLVRMIHAEYRQRPETFRAEMLRASVIGGEPITEDLDAMAGEMFPRLVRISALGATEGILLHTGLHSRYLKEHVGAVGKPLPGMTAELRDEETGKVVTEPNVRGVLYVRGPGVAAGIWNEPEATARNFPDGWWRTGDMLTRDEAGYYYFAGRSDHMFKSGAIKIYSEEVEEALKRHPAVLDAVVVPVGDPTFGLVPFAHVRNSEPLSAQAMEQWWRDQAFEGYSRPRHWRFWGQEPFPMVTLAKIDRRQLAEEARIDTERREADARADVTRPG